MQHTAQSPQTTHFTVIRITPITPPHNTYKKSHITPYELHSHDIGNHSTITLSLPHTTSLQHAHSNSLPTMRKEQPETAKNWNCWTDRWSPLSPLPLFLSNGIALQLYGCFIRGGYHPLFLLFSAGCVLLPPLCTNWLQIANGIV